MVRRNRWQRSRAKTPQPAAKPLFHVFCTNVTHPAVRAFFSSSHAHEFFRTSKNKEKDLELGIMEFSDPKS